MGSSLTWVIAALRSGAKTGTERLSGEHVRIELLTQDPDPYETRCGCSHGREDA